MNKQEMAKLLRAVATRILEDEAFVEDLLQVEPKERKPLIQAGSYSPSHETWEWIEKNWPMTDCKVPLQEFRDYWSGQGKRWSQERWDRTLKRNVVFKIKMDRLMTSSQVHSQPSPLVERMRADPYFHPATDSAEIKAAIRRGDVVDVSGRAFLPWEDGNG